MRRKETEQSNQFWNGAVIGI